jgi:hypothetical protein
MTFDGVNEMKYFKNSYIYKFSVILILFVFTGPIYSDFYSDFKKQNLVIRGGVGYGYSFYGIARGSSFNINPGTGLDAEAGFMYNYKLFALDTGFTFSTINDTHFGADGKQFTTEGGGKMILLEPRVGYLRILNSGTLNYLFLYGGFRYWSADYAYSKIGSAEWPQDDSMAGMGFSVGGKYITTFSVISSWPFVIHATAFISYAPVTDFEREGETIEISEPGGVTPGFEVGFGLANNLYGIGILVTCRYDVIATKFKYREDAGSKEVSSTAGVGTTKVLLTFLKNIDI